MATRLVFSGRTGDVKDGLESHAEVSDLVLIVLLHGLQQHANAFPVVLTEHRVVVGVQRRALHNQHTHTRGQLSLASLPGRLIEYQLRLG